jgi:hypothetical protein
MPVLPVEIHYPLPPEGVRVPVQCADVGFRALPLMSFGENSMNPLLRLRPEGVETCVLAHRVRPYAEIEEARVPFNPYEFLAGNVVELWFHGESTCALFSTTAPWQAGVLTFFWRLGVPLSVDAKRLVWRAYGHP